MTNGKLRGFVARDKTREMSLRVATINYRTTRQKNQSKKFVGKGREKKTMGMFVTNFCGPVFAIVTRCTEI
jgi:hypothetical protein